MKLFDKKIRACQKPKKYNEPQFNYFNTSGRLEIARIRELLEDWFQRFPQAGKSDLCGRFRGRNDIQHWSAFFELYLHELLCCMEFQVEVHPDVPYATGRPEFLVLKGGQRCFYLEATLALVPKDEAGEQARIKQLKDTLNKMDSPNFFLGVRCRAVGRRSAPGACLRQELEQWLAGLDPDKCREGVKSNGKDRIPSFHWGHEGWDIYFDAIARPPAKCGQPGRIIASFTEVKWRNEGLPAISRAINNKATKYGELDIPYVVAVNVIDDWLNKDDVDYIIDGLLGQLSSNTILRPDGSLMAWEKRAGGAWFGSREPQNTRVSAALMTLRLSPWEVATQPPKMFHNPWATRPLPICLWPLPHWIINLNKSCPQCLTGKSTAEVLGLPAWWPFANEGVI